MFSNKICTYFNPMCVNHSFLILGGLLLVAERIKILHNCMRWFATFLFDVFGLFGFFFHLEALSRKEKYAQESILGITPIGKRDYSA